MKYEQLLSRRARRRKSETVREYRTSKIQEAELYCFQGAQWLHEHDSGKKLKLKKGIKLQQTAQPAVQLAAKLVVLLAVQLAVQLAERGYGSELGAIVSALGARALPGCKIRIRVEVKVNVLSTGKHFFRQTDFFFFEKCCKFSYEFRQNGENDCDFRQFPEIRKKFRQNSMKFSPKNLRFLSNFSKILKKSATIT